MKMLKTKLLGVRIIEPDVFHDARGTLVKPYMKSLFADAGMASGFAESFYSISNKNVIRGMHFQTPPHHHAKLIYVSGGAILDVILDLRVGSPTYGQHEAVELSAANFKMVYIPKGCAHGFLALEDRSYTVYLQETMRNPQSEGGIHIDSFGMKWNVAQPILSDRDRAFPGLDSFKSPFEYKDGA